MKWIATLASAVAMQMLLVCASCSRNQPAAAILDPGKVASVVVGRSSRADVLAALGQPNRTERSARGEAWIYEAKTGGADDHGLMSGATAASGVVGAFVPYVGLLGSGLGLAGVAVDQTRPDAQVISLTVTFRDDSVVRDCAYASTAAPADVPGSAPGAAKLLDCQRPAPTAARAP